MKPYNGGSNHRVSAETPANGCENNFEVKIPHSAGGITNIPGTPDYPHPDDVNVCKSPATPDYPHPDDCAWPAANHKNIETYEGISPKFSDGRDTSAGSWSPKSPDYTPPSSPSCDEKSTMAPKRRKFEHETAQK